MEDTTPRLTPPPKPAVLELTTPKHAVPEVSLMCDSESSFTWQAMQHKHTSKTSNQPHGNTKTVRFDCGGQEYNRNTARWPQPQQKQEFLYNFPRVAPSQPVGKGGGQTSPLISPRLLPPQRVILAERGYKGVQHTASSSHSSQPIHPAKEYNPQMYSPVTQRNAKVTSEDQDGPQSDSLLGNQVISSRQRFSPAATVPHTVEVPQGLLPTVPLVVRDVQQERSVESNGTPPPHILPHSSNLQHSNGGDGSSSSSRLRPHILPPGTSTPHTNTYRPPYSPVSLTATTRTITLPPPPLTTSHSAFLASQSLPHFQQPQPPIHNQGYNHHPGLYGNRNWCSPASSSLPASSTSPYITQRPQYPVGEAWGHPEDHYSPVVPAARLPPSPADPVVYGLIEDQKQQILKLTLDLQKIMERQAKEEEDRGTPVTTNHQTRTIERQDVTTQTQGPGQPAVQSIGVNTDISWPHLLASLTQQEVEEEEEEEEEITHPKHSRVQGQEAWLRDIRGSQEPVLSHRHHSPQRDRSESASEVTQDGSQEDSESSSSQAWSEGRPPNLPSTNTANTGPTRFDAGDGWQEALGGRNHGTPSAPSPTPPPTGTTFYHNVMSNIQQILQQTHPTQQQQLNQQQQQQPITPSSQGMVLRGDSEEGSTPDPQIEAVRQQLVNFGISFLDPATLAHTNRPLMDSLYLPGLHNAVSLYQSSISTHLHHPSDATAAKYLTDSQLAAIAAASPAMKKKSSGSTDQPGSAMPPSGLASHHQHHRLFFVNSEGENNNSVSITTKKFLEKYGLQED